MGRKSHPCRSGRPRKRRFHGNQFLSSSVRPDDKVDDETSSSECSESEASDHRAFTSASAAKLLNDHDDDVQLEATGSSDDGCPSSCDEGTDLSDEEGPGFVGFRLFAVDALQDLLSTAASCKHCAGELRMSEVKREGLASVIALSCQSCGMTSTKPLAHRVGRFWDVNRQAVFAMRWIGCGRLALCKICCALNMPTPMSKSAFDDHCKRLHAASQEVAEASMGAAALEAREQNEKEGADIFDAAVSFDGTWMRRGFSSMFGVFTAIIWDTGKVVDFHVSSKYCHQCAVRSSRYRKGELTEAEFEQSANDHHCSKNTDRSAPAMEGEAACLLWQRSEQRRGLRYTTYIGDGDGKGYSAVCAAKPYGPGIAIVKEECVGHVQKARRNELEEPEERPTWQEAGRR